MDMLNDLAISEGTFFAASLTSLRKTYSFRTQKMWELMNYSTPKF